MLKCYQIWQDEPCIEPLVAVALHDGHSLRPEIQQLMALTDAERLREEDPYTGQLTAVAPTRVVAITSRFEVDLNRPREEAVYRTPDDAWGLNLWKRSLPDTVVQRSLEEYDTFYEAMRVLLDAVQARFGRYVVFDLHSYNHRREGADKCAADPETNPQVNIGTGTMVRERWSPVVDRFIHDLRSYDFPGGNLDVRENVKFVGRQLPSWVHKTYPDAGCCLAIEFKKFFMDEWTGEPNRALVEAIRAALQSTVPGIIEQLKRL